MITRNVAQTHSGALVTLFDCPPPAPTLANDWFFSRLLSGALSAGRGVRIGRGLEAGRLVNPEMGGANSVFWGANDFTWGLNPDSLDDRSSPRSRPPLGPLTITDCSGGSRLSTGFGRAATAANRVRFAMEHTEVCQTESAGKY